MSHNRLGETTSPYLLQHEDNPVHWWPWCSEALEAAKAEDKPILLSVGYAACHWCHVMAHESFEDEATAEVMNELFVNIKVDREERPDIDVIYMAAVHQFGEPGGWPLTMFLTPDGRPFWGGTYFPKESKFGKPAFTHVLKQISHIYKEEHDKVLENAKAITAHLQKGDDGSSSAGLSPGFLKQVADKLQGAFDPVHGGIQGAPKFPQYTIFWLLWRAGIQLDLADCRKAIENTLSHICQGGIYDHLGGGFARYSVDERWLAPHFEKMLYDNALLLELLTEVWRETPLPLYEARVRETIAWLKREMIVEGGGFAASLDADSEGEEGRFYVWSEAEIDEALDPEDSTFFKSVYDVSGGGNWEGKNILNRLKDFTAHSVDDEERLQALRSKLLDLRDGRVRPGWDDKVLADWNGLMIAALVRAADVFDEPGWRDLAQSAYDFVKASMTRDGRLIHSYRAGRAQAPATAADYANMIWAALRLHQSKGDRVYLDDALGWLSVLDAHYWDAARGGYYFTADDTTDLIVRTKSANDDALPNANGTMISNLVALSMLAGDVELMDRARVILDGFANDLKENLFSHGGLLAASFDLFSPQQIVVLQENGSAEIGGLAHQMRRLSLPGAVQSIIVDTTQIAGGSPASGKTMQDGKPTAYICISGTCSAPVTGSDELVESLSEQRLIGA